MSAHRNRPSRHTDRYVLAPASPCKYTAIPRVAVLDRAIGSSVLRAASRAPANEARPRCPIEGACGSAVSSAGRGRPDGAGLVANGKGGVLGRR